MKHTDMEFKRVHEQVAIPASANEPVRPDELVDPPERPVSVPRDGKGRPRVFPPEGGKRRSYARCTTFVGCVEDQYQVHLWQQRMTAIGLMERPDLLLSVAANRDDRDALNAIVERAREAAKANTGSTTGTALHQLCEQYDMGLKPTVPPAYQKDIAVYLKATKPFNMVSIEQFCVLDQWGGIGGTPDRVIEFNGRYYIGDIKTGSIEYGILKFAMQFAVYAHSKPYFYHQAPTGDVTIGPDAAAKLRGEWPGEIDQLRAILIHLPQGEGRCDIYWVNISDGWEAVKIAAAVRGWRNMKGLIEPFNVDVEAARAQIDTATTEDRLREIYLEFTRAGHDGELILADCKKKKSDLQSAEWHHEYLRNQKGYRR